MSWEIKAIFHVPHTQIYTHTHTHTASNIRLQLVCSLIFNMANRQSRASEHWKWKYFPEMQTNWQKANGQYLLAIGAGQSVCFEPGTKQWPKAEVDSQLVGWVVFFFLFFLFFVFFFDWKVDSDDQRRMLSDSPQTKGSRQQPVVSAVTELLLKVCSAK